MFFASVAVIMAYAAVTEAAAAAAAGDWRSRGRNGSLGLIFRTNIYGGEI